MSGVSRFCRSTENDFIIIYKNQGTKQNWNIKIIITSMRTTTKRKSKGNGILFGSTHHSREMYRRISRKHS